MIDSPLYDTMQLKSEHHQSDSEVLNSFNQSQDQVISNASSSQNSLMTDSSQMMWSRDDDFMLTMKDVNAELKWMKKKRNLLLKRHHLESVQRKIQALQHQDTVEMSVDNSLKMNNNDSVFTSEWASFIASNKWPAEKNLSAMMI